jgi:hypothetical protein
MSISSVRCEAGETQRKEHPVSIQASPPAVAGDQGVVATLEVDVSGRWDALALSELLVPFHSFLVQHAPDRWVVHARSPGCHGEPLADALRTVEAWRVERGLGPPVRLARPRRRS